MTTIAERTFSAMLAHLSPSVRACVLNAAIIAANSTDDRDEAWHIIARTMMTDGGIDHLDHQGRKGARNLALSIWRNL